MSEFISIKNYRPRVDDGIFPEPINWEIREGEVWTIVGDNASGKTTMANILRGKFFADEGEIIYHFLEAIRTSEYQTLWPDKFIKTVNFKSAYSTSDFKQMYYQQRFHSTEVDECPFLSEMFKPSQIEELNGNPLFRSLNIQSLLNRRIIHLSSGEMRRMIIAKALIDKPRMLIFDNPFNGLDVKMVPQVDELLSSLPQTGVQIMFISPTADRIPSCTTHILQLTGCRITYCGPVSKFKPQPETLPTAPAIDWNRIPAIEPSLSETIVEMRDIEISYGSHIVQQHLNWTIRRGEKWALQGLNGTGKSTLLSYIFADNPQAYAKDIALFGRQRGTGESIWDIKKRIGFTSSEMHLYYREPVSCLKIVESGFFDSIGLYRTCIAEQEQTARYVMQIVGISHLEERTFMKISSAEQRLVLFARTLVKNPEVLILDEPFHGLDNRNLHRCLDIVADFCRQPDKTLVFVTHNAHELPKCIEKTLELKFNS
ncbi:MAG: ATP-binding cassette domain-containing protein [Salinivirgaceae bacterium]|nr:ATP-binding cassette domain-containing protein [Salinivirgaceae bacterium]